MRGHWLKLLVITPFMIVMAGMAQAFSVDGGLLGPIEVTPAKGESKALIFLLATQEYGGLQGLTDNGIVVAQINLPNYLGRLRGVQSDCLYLVSDIELTSRVIQRELGLATYLSPWVVGADGAGSALAYGMLAQAPMATLAGAVMLEHSEAVDTPLPLCPGAQAYKLPAGGFRYAARVPELPGLLVAAPSALDRQASQHRFLAAMPTTARLAHVSRQGSLGARIEAVVQSALAEQAGTGDGLADLPLTLLPARAPGRIMAVVYSGDGGWRDIDKRLAEELAQQNIPVVGVDSLRYFWTEKTPQKMAEDLQRIVDVQAERWQATHVALIGYSFGADILPFLYERLEVDTRQRVILLSMLGLAENANFSIAVTGWLGMAPAIHPTAVPLAEIDPSLLQCVQGSEEEQSGCVYVAQLGGERIVIVGGHHFDGDYRGLARRIQAAIDVRIAKLQASQ